MPRHGDSVRLGQVSADSARYCRCMQSTTVKVSVQTRDRIRALGGETYEDTIVEALDAFESNRFWSQAAAADAWRKSLSDHARQAIAAREAELEPAFNGIE